jgi:hypothetical protein
MRSIMHIPISEFRGLVCLLHNYIVIRKLVKDISGRKRMGIYHLLLLSNLTFHTRPFTNINHKYKRRRYFPFFKLLGRFAI